MESHRTESPDASSPDAADPFTLPDFTPVPVRYRLDGWTPDRQRRYLAALAATGHAGKAARIVGMTEQSAGELRRRPGAESFSAACAAAHRAARLRWKMLHRQSRRPAPAIGSFRKFFRTERSG